MIGSIDKRWRIEPVTEARRVRMGREVPIQYRSKLRHTDRSTEQMQKSLQRRCTAVMGNNCVISAYHYATRELDHTDIMSADVTIGCATLNTHTHKHRSRKESVVTHLDDTPVTPDGVVGLN